MQFQTVSFLKDIKKYSSVYHMLLFGGWGFIYILWVSLASIYACVLLLLRLILSSKARRMQFKNKYKETKFIVYDFPSLLNEFKLYIFFITKIVFTTSSLQLCSFLSYLKG